MEQEVGGSSPPNCTNNLSKLAKSDCPRGQGTLADAPFSPIVIADRARQAQLPGPAAALVAHERQSYLLDLRCGPVSKAQHLRSSLIRERRLELAHPAIDDDYLFQLLNCRGFVPPPLLRFGVHYFAVLQLIDYVVCASHSARLYSDVLSQVLGLLKKVRAIRRR